MGNSNIMVVEDSGIVLLDIQKSLILLGYSVVATASTKEEAIRKAKEVRPDLVLMDIRLGEKMGGIEAADHIREHLDIPIVFLTGYADEDTFQRAKIAGPFGYILKPFDPKGLQTTIEIALHNHDLKKELRESEKRYRTLVETMNDGVCQVDVDGKIIFVNDKLCQMTGFSREDLIGREHDSLFSDEFWQLQQEEFSKHKKGVSNSYETALVRKDGTGIPVILSGSPVQEHDGSFAGAIDVFTNVMPLKHAEAALVESETLYHDLVETAQDLIWQCDAEGRYTYLNPAWEEVFGYKIEEMLGKSFAEFQSPECAARDLKELSRLLQGGTVKGYETVHMAKDGRELHLVFNAKSVYDQDGKVIGTRGTAYDITERKKSEEALRESEDRLRRLSSASHEGLGFSVKGVIVEANEQLARMFGCELSELIGKSAMKFVAPESKSLVMGKINAGTEEPYEHLALKKDGTIFPVEVQARMLNVQGRSIRVTAIRDMTDRKQTEAALQESESKYRSIVESSPLGMHMYELQSPEKLVFVGANPAADKILGVDNSMFIGKSIEEAFLPLADTEVPLRYKEAAEKGIPWQTEQIDYDSEGIRGAFEVIAFQTSPNKMVAMFQDITSRRQAEESLRMRTRELETLFTLSSHLRAAQSADDMLPLVIQELRQVVEIEGSAIILLDTDDKRFVYALGDGLLAPHTGNHFPIENSISGMVMKLRQPYVTEDLSADPNKSSEVNGVENLGPAIIVPLLSETDFLGVIVCGRAKREDISQFSSSDLQLLTAIGEMVGNALRRARLFDQALARLQNVQALHSIDMAISANMDLSVILEVLLTHGSAQLHADAASVLLLDSHTHTLEYEAGYGFRTKAIESARLRMGEGLPGQVALKQEALYIPDISKDDRLIRTKLLDEGFVSYQAAPLVAKGQLQGVLEMFSRTPLTKNEEQANFFETLATQAAIAIDNSQLFTNLERSKFELEMAYEATIEGWSRALDLRDQETEGHTLRVADITVHLAQAMGLKGEKLLHIRRGALLHDIGKMGIPDSILLKPDKLNSEEWAIMKQHPVYAFEMLWQIEFLHPALDIPYCHHEHWDGTGYPRGLKGRDIPLPARIFAVADVWDALISDRPYRQAWSEEKAYRYILAQSSSHFDPEVIDAFVQFYSTGGLPTHGK